MHLQDSYYAEMNVVGNGSQIGYNAPASTVFDYTVEEAGGTATWTAATKSNVTLNDCSSGSWTVASSATSTGLSHTANITGTGCDVLTPSFTQIGAGTH